MKNNERVRNYALITYHTQETIQKVLDELLKNGRVRHYAYIVHDKDKNEDGTLKEIHLHVLLQLNNAMTLTAVRALFPVGANTIAQAMYDKADCFNYLTHKDKPDKYQYPETDIIADNMQYWQSLQKGEADDKTMCIIDDILSNTPWRVMVSRYGRDFVINYSRYACMAEMIRSQERQYKTPACPFTIVDDNGEIVEIVGQEIPTKQMKINV